MISYKLPTLFVLYFRSFPDFANTIANNAAIGLVFTKTPSKKGSFKITHGKNSAYIGARSFFASIIAGDKDALTKYADKYTPQTYNDDKIGKMFYIDLKEKEGNE